MSSEVVKKRGRPKKVVSETMAADNAESTKKATIRQKSTKASAPATDKPTKMSATNVESTTIVSKTGSKGAGEAVKPPVEAPSPAASSTTSDAQSEVSQTPPQPMKQPNSMKPPPPNSKILEQVRRLSSKITSTPESSAPSRAPPNQSRPSPPPTTKLSAPTPPMPSPSPSNAPKNPSHPSPPKTSSTSASSALPRNPVPIAALNSTIVSQLSARAGARPGRQSSAGGGQQLPPNYKPVARRVTMTIVALPIAIVTSWILWERLVLGEERKQLVKPGLALVEEDSSREE